MKHVHIVEPYHSAAMRNMSAPLIQELPKLYKVTADDKPSAEADLNIFLPWHGLADTPTLNSKNIAVYTHVNPGMEPQLLAACKRADLVTAMSYEGRRELVHLGVDPKKIWVNYCAADQFSYRRRTIIVVGYPQPNGRKRESLLLDLAWQYDLSRYEFILVGAGWDDLAAKLISLGVSAQTINADSLDILQAVYRADALLVTGYVEGGPLPLLEAMVSGCKVFSPSFGYAADLLEPDDLYETPGDLMEKMDAYFQRSLDNHYLVRSWTWQDYVAEYALLIGRLLGENVDLYPNLGMSRYTQLLDIIDEIHPQRIIEIGTYKGNTALRMIQQAAKYQRMSDVFYQGFDLFEGQTREDFRVELSKGGWLQGIVQRRLSATKAGVMLVKGYTRDTLPEYLQQADLYFVDGGHSEETIRNDGNVVLSNMPEHAVVIFDDYYTEGKPDGMGCNKFIHEEIDTNKFTVTILIKHTTRTDDGRRVAMVRVQKRDPKTLGGQLSPETWTVI